MRRSLFPLIIAAAGMGISPIGRLHDAADNLLSSFDMPSPTVREPRKKTKADLKKASRRAMQRASRKANRRKP